MNTMALSLKEMEKQIRENKIQSVRDKMYVGKDAGKIDVSEYELDDFITLCADRSITPVDGVYTFKHDMIAWFQYGNLHRFDGPAVEWPNGVREWYQYGLRHRDDGPAYEHVGTGHKAWFQYGKCHREDGPAVENSDGENWWWLNGESCRGINEWAKQLGIFDTEEFTLLKLKYG